MQPDVLSATAHSKFNRSLLSSIKKLFWTPTPALDEESDNDGDVAAEQEALSGKVTHLRIAPSSPIASATPRAMSRREVCSPEAISVSRRRLVHLSGGNDNDDEGSGSEADGEGLFSPAQWRHEEDEKEHSQEGIRDHDREEEEEADVAVESAEGEAEFCPYRFIKSLPPIHHLPPMSPSLPPKSPLCKKMSLVLDLDETLVHCSIEPIPKAELTFSVNHCGVDYQVHARRRPHFQKFVETVATMFEVVVFTASQKVYADKLLNILDPNGTLFAHRLFRESCHYHDGNYLKDLRVLNRSLSRVAIVDNSPQAFGFQIENGIPIESWFEDDCDEELLSLIPFLRRLKDADDVRPIITKQFRLRELIDSV